MRMNLDKERLHAIYLLLEKFEIAFFRQVFYCSWTSTLLKIMVQLQLDIWHMTHTRTQKGAKESTDLRTTEASAENIIETIRPNSNYHLSLFLLLVTS